MRAIHAVRELNEERADPIRVIALYTEPERHALFVRQADEAHCLGPATVGGRARSAAAPTSTTRGSSARSSTTRADAAWVGWGFVAEHPAFAELCERLGIVFAGPDADVMRALGDKIEAKRLAEQAGVPVAPWSGGPVESVEDAVAQGERLGFPLMIKATAGGGGRGMRRVDGPDELATAFERARAEAAQAFGDPGVLMERLVGAARHVEVQLHGRRPGRGVGARRARLLLPAPPPEGGRGVGQPGAVARAGARAGRRPPCGSRARPATAARAPRSSSTSRETGRFSFMEVNARLQVEHPVTEMVTGVDLVRAAAPHRRRRAARGRAAAAARATRSRSASTPRTRRAGSRPRPAASRCCGCRPGPGVRVDSGVAEGDDGPARVRLDDRQDHRPREHPRAGDRAPAPRGRRHDGRARRGHDQPGLPARAARPPGAARRRGRHRLARPAPGAGRRRADPPRRRRARAGGDRALRRGDRRRPRPLLRARPARAAAAPRPTSATRSTSCTAARATG